MQKEALTRSLDVCIQNIQSGENLEKVVELYPQWADELTHLLEAVQVIRIYANAINSPDTEQVLHRTNFLYTAQFGREKSSSTIKRRRLSRWLTWLLAMIILFGGILALFLAASKALPGDWLYPLKDSLWVFQLQVTKDPSQRLRLEVEWNQAKLNEINLLKSLEKSGNINFAEDLKQIQPEKWWIGDQQVRILPDTQIIGQVQEGYYVEVDGFLQADGNVTAARIAPKEFVFTGPVESRGSDAWQVGGLTVLIDQNTLLPDTLQASQFVRIYSRISMDGDLIARFIETIQE